jgi:hypothetical protein
VDIVDDNFIGNKKAVKALLPEIIQWCKDHKWPFEFSTEASINLADDEELMDLMKKAGFAWLFVGIETPDPETLKATQKLQNTRRSIAESIQKIIQHGMIVNAGYIMGFDGEHGNVAQSILDNIEATAVPVNMVGLLFALPNTQLTKRLKREGRLDEGYEIPPAETTCQCVQGLNFKTQRPKADILRDYRRVVEEALTPEAYFGRIRRLIRMLDCSDKRLRTTFWHHMRDLRSLYRMATSLGVRKETRLQFWKTFFDVLFRNPLAVRFSLSIVALYLHFGDFRKYVLERIDQELVLLEKNPSSAVPFPSTPEGLRAYGSAAR